MIHAYRLRDLATLCVKSIHIHILSLRRKVMEHHVVVEKLCSCARRKDMPQIKTFDDKENALRVARAWAQQLNESFCGKHAFDVVEVDDNYVISVGEGSY
jgi:hypothetical protein